MLKEFKEFALRGNAVDLAIGVVIGAAFGKIVTSLVSDVINPIAGVLTGGVDFSELSIVLKEGTTEAAAVTINYGLFINSIVDFLIIAFAIFLVVRQMNRLRNKEEAEKAPKVKKGPTEVDLLIEIRDTLKK